MLLIFGAATIDAALPQQQPGAVPAEKKRAMNKFDPTDLFPEAKEHGRKERTKRDKNSALPSLLASNEPSAIVESLTASRKSSRRRRSEAARSAKSETRLAANTTPAATPAPMSTPSLVAVQKTEPTPSAVIGGAAALTTPPPQTLVASNAPVASSETSPSKPPQYPWLSLPVILTLLSLVALALLVSLAKLMRQFRGPIN